MLRFSRRFVLLRSVLCVPALTGLSVSLVISPSHCLCGVSRNSGIWRGAAAARKGALQVHWSVVLIVRSCMQ